LATLWSSISLKLPNTWLSINVSVNKIIYRQECLKYLNNFHDRAFTPIDSSGVQQCLPETTFIYNRGKQWISTKRIRSWYDCRQDFEADDKRFEIRSSTKCNHWMFTRHAHSELIEITIFRIHDFKANPLPS